MWTVIVVLCAIPFNSAFGPIGTFNWEENRHNTEIFIHNTLQMANETVDEYETIVENVKLNCSVNDYSLMHQELNDEFLKHLKAVSECLGNQMNHLLNMSHEVQIKANVVMNFIQIQWEKMKDGTCNDTTELSKLNKLEVEYDNHLSEFIIIYSIDIDSQISNPFICHEDKMSEYNENSMSIVSKYKNHLKNEESISEENSDIDVPMVNTSAVKFN